MSQQEVSAPISTSGSRMCRTVSAEVPGKRMQRPSQEMQPFVHSSELHSLG